MSGLQHLQRLLLIHTITVHSIVRINIYSSHLGMNCKGKHEVLLCIVACDGYEKCLIVIM
jgi:hypothetical protein